MKHLKYSITLILFINLTLSNCVGSNSSLTNGASTDDSTAEDDNSSTEVSLTYPTETELKLAISNANENGFAVGKALNPIILPACTNDESANVTYSVSGLPDWLSFDETTRTIKLADEYLVVPSNALDLSILEYDCTTTSDSNIAENLNLSENAISFVINDLDGGGISDGYEYIMSKTPLVNRSFGWIWINKDNIQTYVTDTIFGNFPMGLNYDDEGLNVLDANDESDDFVGDGNTNLEEIENGTNIFVPTSSGSFADEVKYNVNQEPQGIDCADYNNDGYIDLAVSNRRDDNLSILLGLGDGSFGPKADISTGDDPFGVISADFDGDGALDLVTTNASDNDISVRLGNGDGSFDNNTDYPVGESSRYIYATTDFDKDGTLDLALTNAGSDNVSIFFGNGDGSFEDSVEFSVGDGPIGLIAADIDNDNDIDLIAANDHVSTVSVLINNGNGVFSSSTEYESGTNPWGITAGDYNGDFIIDLAVANYNGGNISILIGTGDGSFGSPTRYNTVSNPTMIVSGDFNGDRAIDLAVACRENGGSSSSGKLSILMGVGDGSFNTKVDYDSTGDPLNLCTADFNNDGLLDIATVNYQHDDVSVFIAIE